jgi:hypothetical protein
VALAVFMPRFVEREVIAQAEARGFELVPGKIGFGWGWVQISDAKLSLIGVRGLSASAAIVDVELDRVVPLRFTLNEVKVEAVGDPVALARALDSWRAAHEKSLVEPVFIKPLSLSVRRDAKAAPSAVVTGAEVRLDKERASVRASSVKVGDRELGALSATHAKDSLRLGLTLGMSSFENPLLTLETRSAPKRTLQVGLSPLALGRLSTLLGRELPLPEVLLSGSLEATFPANSSLLSGVDGRVDATLKGYVPPHPPELDGFVFGDTTQFGSRFVVELEQARIRLEQTVVKAGAFALEGGGELRLEADRLRLVLALKGQLPCAALAGAAAETRLGRALGRVTGKAAREVFTGSVGIRVAIDADHTNLGQARVLKTISPGCGLKPLTLAELQALGELLPEALDPAVARDLETLLKGPLPTLPNLGAGGSLKMPGFAGLPGLELQLPKQAPTTPAPKPTPAPTTSAKR